MPSADLARLGSSLNGAWREEGRFARGGRVFPVPILTVSSWIGLAWGGSPVVEVAGFGLNDVENSGGSRGFEGKRKGEERGKREEGKEKKKSVFWVCSGF